MEALPSSSALQDQADVGVILATPHMLGFRVARPEILDVIATGRGDKQCYHGWKYMSIWQAYRCVYCPAVVTDEELREWTDTSCSLTLTNPG